MKSRISVLLVAFAMLFAAAIPETATGKSPKVRNGMIEFPEPARAKGQTDVLQLRCDPIPVVRVAFIGLGMRGSMAVERYTHLDGVRIVALCDVRPELVENAQGTLKNAGLPAAAGYTGAEDWKKVCEREDVDLIYNCTPWLLHTPIAVYAMRHGKHVALEVPAAMSIDECWQLVNTAEQTRRHCMMLENCCYDFFEMATLNMAQQGLFGEVMHVEGAYIHDLRSLNLDDKTGYYDMWRLKYNTDHTGNPYPTHGLGPVCQILNIHRGDKMDYLVSVSTDQTGLSLAAAGKFEKDSEYAETDYKLGDMNTTLIRTAKGAEISCRGNRSRTECAFVPGEAGVRSVDGRVRAPHFQRDRREGASGRRARRHGLYHGLPVDLLPAQRAAAGSGRVRCRRMVVAGRTDRNVGKTSRDACKSARFYTRSLEPSQRIFACRQIAASANEISRLWKR